MSRLKRNSIIVSGILIIGAVIIGIYIQNNDVIETNSAFYELVSKEKFLTQAPIIAEITSLEATEKNIEIAQKSVPVKEYVLNINNVYKGNLQKEQQIVMQDDGYMTSKPVINEKNEIVYEATAKENIDLENNKQYLIFLIIENGVYKTFCGFQGIFTFDENKKVYINEMGVEITNEELNNV